MNKNKEIIIEKADACVKCGLCSSVCPTYEIDKSEFSSPRGRISLMLDYTGQKLKAKQIAPYISKCIGCMNCEIACPSKVDYSTIFNLAKQEIQKVNPPKYEKKLLNYLLKSISGPIRLRIIYAIFRWYQFPIIFNLFKKTGLNSLLRLNKLTSYLPKLEPYLKFNNKSSCNHISHKIGLIPGCVSSLVERKTINMAIEILEKLGYSVLLPKNNLCCGAFAKHDGSIQQAKKSKINNLNWFLENRDIHKIITLSSACNSTFISYSEEIDEGNKELSAEFSSVITELSLLIKENISKVKNLKPIPGHAVLYIPCSQRAKEGAKATIDILASIPKLKLTIYDELGTCCGSGGDYFINNPETADKLANKVIKKIINLKPDYLLVPNIGCRLHLERTIKAQNIGLEAIHPLVLIHRTLFGL